MRKYGKALDKPREANHFPAIASHRIRQAARTSGAFEMADSETQETTEYSEQLLKKRVRIHVKETPERAAEGDNLEISMLPPTPVSRGVWVWGVVILPPLLFKKKMRRFFFFKKKKQQKQKH